MKCHWIVVVVMFLAVNISAARAEVLYSVFDLTAEWEKTVENPEDYAGVYAQAINDRGQVTGYVISKDSKEAYAFVWGLEEGWREIRYPGANLTRGADINNHGQVAVGGTGMRARLWDPLMGFQELSEFYTSASGVNDLGHVVGTVWPEEDEGFAFVWKDGQIHNLGTLGGTHSSACAVNNFGQIVGTSGMPQPTAAGHAFLWTEDHGMQDLGVLGSSGSTALDINDRGQIVGSSNVTDEGNRAFLWEDGQMRNLGTLDGDERSSARAINNRGQIVGRSDAPSESTCHSFLWDEETGMHNLNDLLVQGTGWQIGGVSDINDAGWIVCTGSKTDGSGYGTIILRPVPEPTSVCLLLEALLAMVVLTFGAKWHLQSGPFRKTS